MKPLSSFSFSFVFLLCLSISALTHAQVPQTFTSPTLKGTATVPVGATFKVNGTIDLTSATPVGFPTASARVTAINGLSGGANYLPYFTGTDTFGQLSLSPFTQSLFPLSSSSAWLNAIMPSSPTTGDIVQWNGTAWVKVSLGSLATGIPKITTATGAITIAVAGTDYVAPGSVLTSGLTVPSGYLLGRATAATGAPEAVIVGDNLLLDPGTATLHSTAPLRSRVAKTSAYTVVAADKGQFIDCTSGTFTLSLTAAATLGAGFHVTVYNSGTGVITIDPDSAETIRDPLGSVLTKTLVQGESMTLMCDGSGFFVSSHAVLSGVINLTTLTWAATTDLAFNLPMQSVTLTGNTTFTTSGRSAPRQISLRIICDATGRTLTWPSGWIWVGGSAPASIAASKTALLSAICFGTTDSTIIAAYAVQP